MGSCCTKFRKKELEFFADGDIFTVCLKKNQYNPGDVVTGTVYVKTGKVAIAEDQTLKITLFGEERVFWSI